MVARQVPPARTSIDTVSSGISASLPPYLSAKRSGSVHSRHTRSRGASKTLVIVSPGSSAIAAQSLIHAIEAALPEAAVGAEPLRRVPERFAVKARRPELRGPAAADQAGALEDLEVA